MSGLLIIFNIDSCGIFDNGICFCLICEKLLLLRNQPKFGIFNSFFHVDYQSYLLVLADFSIVEEAAIICVYPILFILKLKLFEIFNPAAYSGIKGYAVLFSHNPALLLIFFPSPTLALHDIICIVWAR